MFIKTITGLSLALAALALAGSALAAPDTVTTPQGALHGALAGSIASFKAIPFAAPPVGPLRWRPPEPAKPWTGVRQATAFGPACMQLGRPEPGIGQSEDCLTLNVWKPAAAGRGARLPVMVWIHGGSFTGGTGASPYYDGTEFARRGIVLVTVNYRLGRLGFFAHPALTAEQPGAPLGSYGLMDNLAALRWVQANIASFGGDPANVTVFGESAGAMLVNDLMILPEAKGLFAKAIAQSGFGRVAPNPIRGDAPRTAEQAGQAFAAAAGITGTGPEALAALRALSAAQLSAPGPDGAQVLGATLPILDGVLLTESPEQAFRLGHEAQVPYMAGGNSFDASLFPDAHDKPETVLAPLGPARDRILAAYGGDPATAAQDLTTDGAVLEPDRLLARLHTKNGQPAFVYYLSYLPARERGVVHGVPHAGELAYVFGTLRAPAPEDRKISAAMTDAWAAFAKSSDPGKAAGPPWPREDATDPVLEFGADGVQVRPHFRQLNLDIAERILAARAAAGR